MGRLQGRVARAWATSNRLAALVKPGDASMVVEIAFAKLVEHAVAPAYATLLSSGMDLVAAENRPLYPAADIWDRTKGAVPIVLVSTGIAVAIPEGYEGQVRSRSGLAVKHGVVVAHGIGTIDADYRGELKVPLINLSTTPFRIQRGDRIAQLVIAPVAKAKLSEVKELDSTKRNTGGFGSTGR
jgi:dUTP pyrophosphatase